MECFSFREIWYGQWRRYRGCNVIKFRGHHGQSFYFNYPLSCQYRFIFFVWQSSSPWLIQGKKIIWLISWYYVGFTINTTYSKLDEFTGMRALQMLWKISSPTRALEKLFLTTSLHFEFKGLVQSSTEYFCKNGPKHTLHKWVPMHCLTSADHLINKRLWTIQSSIHAWLY